MNPVCNDAAKDSCGPSTCAPTPTNTQLVNLPIEADVGYAVGSVSKKVDLLLM